MTPEEIILRDVENYLVRLEVQMLENTKNLIDMQRRIRNVLEKYEN